MDKYNLSLPAETIDELLLWLDDKQGIIIKQTDLLSGTGQSTTATMTQKAITDALGTKADASSVYTKTQTDTLLNGKANVDDVYTKARADALLAEKESEIQANTDRIALLEYATAKDLSYVNAETGLALDSRSTANAYIVRKAGAYRIPLVYGNSIKNGNTNSAAYTRQGSDYTADFVNHLGNAVTSPWIERNEGCAIASVGLLWQSAVGMITDTQIYDGQDGKYLAFSVANVPTTNGLATLYVKDDNGDIMWSWTIWVTSDAFVSATVTNHTSVEYDMMSVPFGAIWNAERTKYVLPYYQWGRKDAMIPAAAYNSDSNMIVYDIDGNVYSGYGALGTEGDMLATKTVANSIKNPNLFFTSYDTTNYNWNNLAWFNNFWNAAITTSSDLADNQDAAIKTIYDPMPNGWMIPAGRFATGFTTTGNNTSTPAEFNVIGGFANGWNLKKNATDTEGIFVTAAGYRGRASGGLDYVGSIGGFWSFAPYSQTGARSLSFYSGGVYPLNIDFRASGFSVVGVRELS